MKLLSQFFPALLLLCALGLALEPRAYAYVDPGSGLLITQTAGAVLTATVFWFRRQIRAFFGRFSATKRAKQ